MHEESEPWSRTKSPETDSILQINLICDKGKISNQWSKGELFH